ncbi:MAG: nucleotide sugar dehydrogenase [Rhodospirillales bacterium]|nr:nucleotide sugar dehydrogenase [Rhodospirillales bacterium]
MKLSVIGLGKLGAPLAAVMASKGFEVLGADLRRDFVDSINAGQAPVVEPRLQELIDASKGRLRATTDVEEAVRETDASFVIVPTPTGPDGIFLLDYVMACAKPIGQAIAEKSSYHLVVITSTVMPGDTGTKLVPALEEASGKRCGADFGVCYNPEFIALGSVVYNMLNPDFILVGESDAKAGAMLETIYRQSCDKPPHFAHMNFVNAELAKISVNSFVTMRISFANQLARICDFISGADVDVITSAIGLDTRIGRKYLKGAVSFGGPCFPRDNVAFAKMAAGLGTEAPMALATDKMNNDYLDHLAAKILRLLPRGGVAGLLGMSYKPDTGVIDASPSVELARRLLKKSCQVIAHDPLAIPEARAKLGEHIVWAATMNECAREADVLIILVPWPEYAGLEPGMLKNGGKGVSVLDCWRQLPSEQFAGICHYELIGCPNSAQG